MIVSHPTDEILFGGAHLLEGNYLVVCITCGNSKETTHDFIDVLQKTNQKYCTFLFSMILYIYLKETIILRKILSFFLIFNVTSSRAFTPGKVLLTFNISSKISS